MYIQSINIKMTGNLFLIGAGCAGGSITYRRIFLNRKLSNRLTSGSAANTNKTYEGKSSYAMYFMPYCT